MTKERYSRLKLFGLADFEKLGEKRALVVGIGGLGSVVAEIMTRCGIGTLVLFDYDVLEEANLNRMIYKPSQIGMKKADILREYLKDINPGVNIVSYPFDITDGEGYERFLEECRDADVVFGCVDTFHVRNFINKWCVKYRRTLIDGGASEDGINGSVRVIVPGKTACYRCHTISSRMPVGEGEIGKKVLDDGSEGENGEDGESRQEEGRVTGICHVTSLPTTMTIISALQCQEALKYLLGFGSPSPYLMYYGLDGRLEEIPWERNENCTVCGKKKKGPPKALTDGQRSGE